MEVDVAEWVDRRGEEAGDDGRGLVLDDDRGAGDMGAGANASTDDPRPAVLAVARDEFRHRGMHDGARNAGLSDHNFFRYLSIV